MRAAIHLVSLAALLLSSGVPLVGQHADLEYEVKAAFVLNFVRYVTWPAAERRPPFRVCMLGSHPFGSRLEAVLDGEAWEGGTMELRQVRSTREAQTCHLLYVPARATTDYLDMHSELAPRPILTVGESKAFLNGGGMIHLFLESNKVRFSINLGAAEKAGLQISSRLLRLARDVVGTRTAG